MTEQKLKDYYDEIYFALLTNIYTISKDRKKIILKNFSPANKKHRRLFMIAELARNTFDFPIYLNCSLFKFLKFKSKHKNIKWAITAPADLYSCDKLIRDIENAFNDPKALLEDCDEF